MSPLPPPPPLTPRCSTTAASLLPPLYIPTMCIALLGCDGCVGAQPPGDTLADIATLPDSYDHNSGGSWSSDLHYVDLPGT